jgi:hypothetical protein
MAIQGSGAISFSDLAEEFGDTAPHSFSEFYREGSLVPGVNSNVAASGAIRLGTFYNSVNELLQAVTSSASINAQTIFGSDWGTNIPKRLSIPSGVTVGPLTIPSGMGGSLEVDVAGEIQGTGGSAGGGAGGNAITSNTSFTLNVLSGGAVRGGGGGGGAGGTGGGGSYTQTVNQSSSDGWYIYTNSDFSNSFYRVYLSWNGGYQGGWYIGSGWRTYTGPISHGGWSYTRGSKNGGNNDYERYAVSRSQNQTVNTNGGSGGAGGRGQGYNQSLASGSGGAGGGTNAGTGGTGGSGGGFGSAGSTGNTGANGNRTNGSGGSGGGAAGRAVQMNAGTVTVNNSGTINGAY